MSIEISREHWKKARDFYLQVAGLVFGMAAFGFNIIITNDPLINFKNFLVAGAIIVLICLIFENIIKKIINPRHNRQLYEIQIIVITLMLLALAFVLKV